MTDFTRAVFADSVRADGGLGFQAVEECGQDARPRNASAAGSDTRFDLQRIGFAASIYGLKLGSVAGVPRTQSQGLHV
jgi:hypothetical protein